MQPDVPVDYAVFQLSPRRSRCELFVSYDGTTEKLASGLLKPYVTHLRVAEEQVALAVKSIKLEVERYKNAETWFTKGTLERFVQFVGTPEVLEMVNTFDAEMSQLEAARKIYSQGSGDCGSGTSGADGVGATAASDATKKELLRAIDVRLAAVKQDLTTACSRASASGFSPESVSALQLFADRFGAHRLSEACGKFLALTHQRSDLFSNDNALRLSTGSDMSLDDPSEDQSKASTCITNRVVTTFPLRRFSREPNPSPIDDVEKREDSKDKGTSANISTTTESSSKPSGTPQLTRRLSVQERISMFENKAQKDSSPSTSVTPTSTGGKPELRRLSSDVNSSDKAVLRRWSGASDMSIDVSGDKKEPDGNANTPTSTSTSTSTFRPAFPPKSKEQYDLKSEEGDKNCKLPVGTKCAGLAPGEPSADSNSKIASFLERSSNQTSGKIIRSRAASIGRGEDFGFENQSAVIQSQFRSLPGDQTATEKVKSSCGGGSTPQEDIWINSGSSAAGTEGSSVDTQGDAESDELKDQPVSRSNFVVAQRRTVETVSATSKVHAQPVNQNTGVDTGSLPWGSSLGVEAEKPEEKHFESVNVQTDSNSMQMENASLFRGKSQGHGFASDQVKKPGGKRVESTIGGNQMGWTWKDASEDQEVFTSVSSLSMDQAQRARQPKGNQEMNDELKIKANELEKLFAEHKLRVPGDQSNSARRIRPPEISKEMEAGFANRKLETDSSSEQVSTTKLEAAPAACSSSKEKFTSTPLSKTVDNNNDYDVTPKHNIYSMSFSDDSRGKLYERYMQKRDVKLRDDWSSKRPEKEAKLKAMQDSLEKSRAEMKVKLAGSADKRSAATDRRQRAEKMRSFNVRSAIKRDQSMDSCMSDEDEDQTEFHGKKLSDAFLGDSSSRSAQSKKVLPNRNTTSSTPRNSTMPIPRSSGKGSNSAAGRRRLPVDNLLAQSVPNFSDLRKENTKPSSAGSKTVRPQGRNLARKKSISEDVTLVNEEMPRRSQSLRKSAASPMELNDSRDYDDVDDTVLTPSKHDEVENEDFGKISRDTESKTLPRKGNCVGRNTGAGNRSKASEIVDVVRNGHNNGYISFETEVMTDVAKGEEDDFKATVGEESAAIDNSKGRLSQESDKSGNFGYDNSNDLRLLSQTGSISAAELPASLPSFLRSMGSIQDSPGESPGSWNSRLHNPFSFQHEISDIDASDSPIGSPASWNFHTLAQSEMEAARMRKKWGAAQKPIVGVDSSNGQSRKDVTRGLKRFLKFGRKNRASESMADWISATTSEGDDSEDGRDLANRSSEDLRKSRMGSSQSHNSDEGFNDSDLFSEQVHALRSSIPTPPANFKLRDEHVSGGSLKAPKSFFSLSNFRSKGSDSKHR